MTAEVMPEGFTPRRRGRKPKIDITEMLKIIEDNKSVHGPGRWTGFVFLSRPDAESAKRQLDRMGFEVSMDSTPDKTTIYARYMED